MPYPGLLSESQPWALLRNPFGIGSFVVTLGLEDAIPFGIEMACKEQRECGSLDIGNRSVTAEGRTPALELEFNRAELELWVPVGCHYLIHFGRND